MRLLGIEWCETHDMLSKNKNNLKVAVLGMVATKMATNGDKQQHPETELMCQICYTCPGGDFYICNSCHFYECAACYARLEKVLAYAVLWCRKCPKCGKAGDIQYFAYS